MNTKLNKIFKSFEDVKLESQEVELSVIDDLTKLVGGNKNAISEANRFVDNVKITFNKLNNIIDDIENMRSYVKSIPSAKNALGYNNQEINKFLAKIELQSKDLGIDVKSVKGYMEAKNTIEKNKEYIKQLDQAKAVGENVLSQIK